MKKIQLFMSCIFVLFIVGCNKSSKDKDHNISQITEPFYYEQWYINKNDNFYTKNQINNDASIHSSNILEKYSGKGVKIAVIDDGLDRYHEDLNNSILYTYNIDTNSTNVSHTNSNNHHGTAVTGIIASRKNNIGILGIAYNSKIIFLKATDETSDSQIIELFNKAEELGADIINCSWGTYDVSDIVKDKIINLSNNGRNGKGIIFVFASGNDDNYMGNDESAILEVISVGATDKDNLRAFYSNYGENLDLVAPGGYTIAITTLDPMNENGVSTINNNYLLSNDVNGFIGTSSSAPIVSSVIALMLEKKPSLTRIEVENILKNNCDKIGNLNYENNRNDYYGYGKINLTKIMGN